MTTIRLAAGTGPPQAFEKGLSPTVRLAMCVKKGGAMRPENLSRALPPAETFEDRPALLCSFFYYREFAASREKYCFRDWALDSGAYSAHASGATIDLEQYIELALELQANDPQLVEIFGLDVIGDWKASHRNIERMWEVGVPAIPTYHYGSPEAELLRLAKEYPKIALGGAARGRKDKLKWAQQCFARVWPKKVHGFGFGSDNDILALPWHSVDATNWEFGPCAYGKWIAFGKRSKRGQGKVRQLMSVRGSDQNLRAEVEHYLKLERRARQRWKREMALLEATPDPKSPNLRLAVDPSAAGGKRAATAFGGSPWCNRDCAKKEDGDGVQL